MTPEQLAEARALIERLTGYTPGPWSFEVESGDWPDHALIGGDGDPVIEWDFDLGFRLSGSDARLIAAAPAMRDTIAALLDHIEALTADRDAALVEVARCHARLEIDHEYVSDADGNVTRQEIPHEDRANEPDGIECRDETIRLLERQLRAARAEKAEAEAAMMRKALERIQRLSALVAHDLTMRVEAGKVAAVQQCSDIARAALAGGKDTDA